MLLILWIAIITSAMTKADSIRLDHRQWSNRNSDRFIALEPQGLTCSPMFLFCTTEAAKDHLYVTDAHKISWNIEEAYLWGCIDAGVFLV